MRSIFLLIAVAALATSGVSTAIAGERAINHNAVLITGDTPDNQALEGFDMQPTEDSVFSNWLWNGAEEPGKTTVDEFWNDTYLMWEIMWVNECYNLHGTAPGSDHIHVLYGDGEDYPERGFRYDPIQQFPGQGIDYITDYGAYYDDVANIFNRLAYGGNGIEPMTAQDNFFCWTFGQGIYWYTDFLVLDKVDLSIVGRCKIAGTLETPPSPHHFAVQGNYAYVAGGNAGLRVIDLTDPQNPVEVGHFITFNAKSLAVRDSYVYVADDLGGLRIIDVSNPSSPTEFDSMIFPNDRAISVQVSGDYIYVGTLNRSVWIGSLRIIEFRPGEIFQEVGCCEDFAADMPFDIEIAEGYAYVAAGGQGFYVIDVDPPTSPEAVANLTITYAQGVCISDSFAYVSTKSWGWAGGVWVIDIGDPENPFVRDSWLKIEEDYLDVDDSHYEGSDYVCIGGFKLEPGYGYIHLIDVSNPDDISLVDTYSEST